MFAKSALCGARAYHAGRNSACAMERERERELYLVDRERTRVLAQDLEHAQHTIEWLRVTAGAQLAEASLAVAQMSQQMALVQSRFAGEQSLHQASWDRRLALAQAEWGSQCERLRAECGSSLREAEELLALRAEEASVAKAEKELLEAQLDFARRELGVQRRLLRHLLERAHGAELREAEARTEAQAQVEDAAQRASAHDEHRRRAEVERGVAVAALGILDGAEAYLELLGDVSISPAAREIAMLKARLREAEQLMGAAGLARHEVAAMRHATVCAEARSAALEARLATFEAEGRGSLGRGAEAKLLQRRLDEALATGAAQLKQATLLARGRELDADALQAKQLELDGQTALVTAARAEVAAAVAELEAGRQSKEQGAYLEAGVKRSMVAVQAQNEALRRELDARRGELAALHARLRAGGWGEAEAGAARGGVEGCGSGGGGGSSGGGGGSSGGGPSLPPPHDQWGEAGPANQAAAEAAAEGAAEGAVGGGVQAALAYGRLHAAEAQLRVTRAAVHAGSEEARRSRREAAAPCIQAAAPCIPAAAQDHILHPGCSGTLFCAGAARPARGGAATTQSRSGGGAAEGAAGAALGSAAASCYIPITMPPSSCLTLLPCRRGSRVPTHCSPRRTSERRHRRSWPPRRRRRCARLRRSGVPRPCKSMSCADSSARGTRSRRRMLVGCSSRASRRRCCASRTSCCTCRCSK